MGIPKLRHLPKVYPVGIHYNKALLRLTKNLCQPYCGKHPAAQHVTERKTGPHRRQLVRISHQNQPFPLGHRPQKTSQKQHIHHGHLVHDHRVGFQRVIFIPGKDHFPGGRVDSRFQKPVDGGGILPGDLGKPFGCPACGSRQHIFQAQIRK